MADKTERPKPFQVRLDEEEVEAFATLLERRKSESAKSGGSASVQTVLRALVRGELKREGLLPKRAARSGS